MNKEALLEFINSLPDNLEVEPFRPEEISFMSEGPEELLGLNGSAFRARYSQQFSNVITIRLRYKEGIQFEFERNNYGFPCVTNVRHVKEK